MSAATEVSSLLGRSPTRYQADDSSAPSLGQDDANQASLAASRPAKPASVTWHPQPGTVAQTRLDRNRVCFSQPVVVKNGFQAAFGKSFGNWLLDLLGARIEVTSYRGLTFREARVVSYTGVLFGFYRWDRVCCRCEPLFIPFDHEYLRGEPKATGNAVSRVVGDGITWQRQQVIEGLEDYILTRDDAMIVEQALGDAEETRTQVIAMINRAEPSTSEQVKRLALTIGSSVRTNPEGAEEAFAAALAAHEDRDQLYKTKPNEVISKGESVVRFYQSFLKSDIGVLPSSEDRTNSLRHWRRLITGQNLRYTQAKDVLTYVKRTPYGERAQLTPESDLIKKCFARPTA